MIVKDVVREYRASPGFRELADDTKRQYTSELNRLNDKFGDRAISKIKRADLIRQMNSMGNTPAMAGRFARVSSVLFSYALDMEYIEANPASRLKKPKIGTLARWSMEEVMLGMKVENPLVRTAIWLAFYTGQREGDVLRMTWHDIKDGTAIKVKQKKTGTYLEIELHPSLRKYLKKLPKENPEIVGRSISTSGFRSMFKRDLEKVGVYKTFHGLRKTVASYLGEVGTSTKNTADLLGHKTLKMAEKYLNQADRTKSISNAVKQLPVME